MAKIPTFEANSFEVLIQTIRHIFVETKRIWWFRGHSDAVRYTLTPSIWRGNDREEERYMTNEFLFKARSRIAKYPNDGDWAGWLALMQHYRLPTRLLDWTYSPLIALFFALSECHRHSDKTKKEHHDACIWMLSPGELNTRFEFESFIYPINYKTPLEMIKPAFKQKFKENEKVIAVSSIENDPRMVAQQSAFTIHSLQQALETVPGSQHYLRKITLPAKNLLDFSIELEILGVRLSTVFPDLENLSTEIKSYHSK